MKPCGGFMALLRIGSEILRDVNGSIGIRRHMRAGRWVFAADGFFEILFAIRRHVRRCALVFFAMDHLINIVNRRSLFVIHTHLGRAS
jgi:hypothetical protein